MRKIRDYIRFFCAFIFIVLYIPHLLIYFLSGKKRALINADVERTDRDTLSIKGALGLLYLLHNDRYFRSLFYYRIGAINALLIRWWRPGDRYFIISYTTEIGPGVQISHPYSTILNAERIGENFSCLHCTTLGNKSNTLDDKGSIVRPVIGDNVTLGANVTIIGGVKIGNNVTIGAGTVVVKDIPDNAIAVGNPARVIKYKK